MRILLITDNHTPTGGGAEKYFFELKHQLQAKGMTVFSLGFGPVQSEGEDFCILNSCQSKAAKLLSQLFFHPFLFKKINSIIKKFQPDVIHLHNIKQYTATLLPAIGSYPLVQTLHDYSLVCPLSQNIHQNKKPCPTGFRMKCFWQHRVKYNMLVYLAMVFVFYLRKFQTKKMVNLLLAPSPQLTKYLQINNFNNVRTILPFKKRGGDYSFKPMQASHFLYIGQLSLHKGVDILLDEFYLAWQKNPRLTLSLAGTGEEEHQLKRKAKKLKMENHVTFLGWQNDLESCYTQCAAVIFPSIGFEAFGLVMTEAMRYAKPVIGADRSTCPWLIEDGKTGLIFNPLVKGDLAEKILMLADNTPLIEKLGINGFEKLNTLIDNDQAVQKIIEIYNEVTQQST